MDDVSQKSSAEGNTSVKNDNTVTEEEPKVIEKEPSNDVKVSEDLSSTDKPSNVSCKSPSDKTIDKNKSSKEKSDIDEVNLHYEDGACIYTEPESKCQYLWDEEKQEWVSRDNSSSFSDKDYDYDGQTYTYLDKETNIKYLWDVDTNEWKAPDDKTEKGNDQSKKDGIDEDDDENQKKPKEITKQDMSTGHYGFENDTHIYTDPADGSKYFWDKEKNAWFPKVDDDFLAQYQMNYGFTDPNENKTTEEDKKQEPLPPLEPPDNLKRKAPQEPAWFDVGEESTKVYVSGLPLDITETEFIDVMQKCGLVMKDVDNGKMKVKIYIDSHTSLPKGDALCTYIKKESVDLALNLLDGSDVRGHRITVERAKFTMKGDAYDPSLKPKKKRKKDKEKLKKIQEKLFDWRPDKFRGERSKHERIVIVKNLFDPVMFNKDVKLILEYQQDLREECIKCGGVRKVVIYDRHPEGVAQISFKEFEAADACVQLLNGRWFGQRKITAETWDGKTKYKISETDEQIKARIEKWEKFLETGGAGNAGDKLKANPQEEVENKEKSVSEENQNKEEVKKDSGKVTLDLDDTRRESDQKNRDSDAETRSSVGSDYETDDEIK